MDSAYDHIQEESLSPEHETTIGKEEQNRPRAASGDLGTEFKEAYQAISTTAWGARLGGFFGQVKKQSESFYEGTRKELDEVTAEASKGWTGLVSQASTLAARSQAQAGALATSSTSTITTNTTAQDPSTTATDSANTTTDPTTTPTPTTSSQQQQPDLLAETSHLVTRLTRSGAARLKQIQAAEDAADDALERFGSNITAWFKDAVSVAPPSTTTDGKQDKSEVLFESKDAEGKRIVHATRFDAQVHVIHSRLSSFTEDPDAEGFVEWKEGFDVEGKTGDIKRDLERYEELRRAMERLVPEQVSYAEFWCRYYFLRYVVESEERKRRELLREAVEDGEEDVGWGDEEEDEVDDKVIGEGADEKKNEVPRVEAAEGGAATPKSPTSSTQPIEAEDANKEPASEQIKDNDFLKPNEPRRSNEHSVADSDASYDLVSGAPSRGPNTPEKEKRNAIAEQSDEEDWE